MFSRVPSPSLRPSPMALMGSGWDQTAQGFLAVPEWGGGGAGLLTSSPAWVLPACVQDGAALALERGPPPA